jgi:tRNA threonylcarbamoyladenosine biosynthesis protein TsaB
VVILALDTSAAAGSAAIVRDGALAIERAGDPARTHGERLPRELMTLLDDARVRLDEIDMFAIATGPGSFTGLRIGIATIQGLALAQGKLVVPVSTFEALADFRLKAEATPVGAWIDAHRGEVFATLYAADGTVLQPPTSLPPDATLDAWAASLGESGTVRFAGDGAVKYRAAIEARLGARAGIPATVPPIAGVVGLLAAREPGRAVRPHAIVPLYVRRSDAELARDRRHASGGD